jgi:hypothetical protein
MSILDLGTGPSRPSVGKKSTRIFLGFGLLVAVIGIGSTFASTISINANQDIEFGQGVQKSIFCGGEESITVTPISSFANNEELGTFGFTGITISDIPEKCSDRDFIIKTYDNNQNASPLILSKLGLSELAIANVWWANGCPEDNEENDCRLQNSTTTGGYVLLSKNLDAFEPVEDIASVIENSSTSFTITFTHPFLSSDAVKKIVIETQNDTYGFDRCVELGNCSVNS